MYKNNNSIVNELRFTNDELSVIGIMILMVLTRGLGLLKSFPTITEVEEAVSSIPTYNASKEVDISKFFEKVAKLKFCDLVKVFVDQSKNIVLPDFSYDEKNIIANCTCGSAIDGGFVQRLDMNVVDYIQYDLNQNVLVGENNKFAVKVRNLDYAQRVKLIYLVITEFFEEH